MRVAIALAILSMGRVIRMPVRQQVREATQEFVQPGAYLAARMATHIAPREKQHVHARAPTIPVREDPSRDAADAATRPCAACRPPQRHEQSSPSAWCSLATRRPRTRARPDAAPPQSRGRRSRAPPPRHPAGLHCEPASPLGPTPLQHLATVRCAHPLAEAVTPLALASVWLICSLHEPSMGWGKRGIIWRVPSVCQVLRRSCDLLCGPFRRLAPIILRQPPITPPTRSQPAPEPAASSRPVP